MRICLDTKGRLEATRRRRVVRRAARPSVTAAQKATRRRRCKEVSNIVRQSED